MRNLEPFKNQSGSLKSPGNLFLKKGTNPVYCFQNVGGTSQVIRKTQLLDRLTVLHQFRSSVTMFAN